VSERYTDDDILRRIKRCYQLSESHADDWRNEARELYALIAGDQWPEEDMLRMMETLRPAVTFNVAGKYLDAVSGLQVANRQEVKYLPREPGDSGVNELLTGAADWVRDEADAEDEESEAFYDLIVSGMGCVEMSINFDDNPAGNIAIERRDPLEMFWDPRAKKRNVRDARWCMRVSRMTEDDIVDRWGQEAYDSIVGTMGIEPEILDNEIHHATEAWKYEHDMIHQEQMFDVPVIEYQYWRKDSGVLVKTQFGEKRFTLPQWRKMKKVLEQNGVPYQAQRIRQKRYFKVFAAGDQILEHGESPYQEGFTFKFMTGKRERNKNLWYGIARSIKDPQQWVNKLFSSILHTVSVGSKGGLIAEEGAFSDPQKAEDEWAKPDGITFVEDGVVRDGRIQQKDIAPYPAGTDALMQFALGIVPETSGLNMEIMGMANRVQPGVVEAQRKQAAMTVISWAFDAMRRYYKDHGRQLAYYIREYISDGRLARVTTQTGQQYIPLVKDELTMEFDVIVDEAPTSLNVKERVWAVLEVMLPRLLEMGLPIPPEALDYSPLPSDLATKWKEMMTKPDPQKQQMQQLEMKDKEAEIKKDESTATLNLAKARTESAKAGATAAGG
jgi:hypothetical protein